MVESRELVPIKLFLFTTIWSWPAVAYRCKIRINYEKEKTELACKREFLSCSPPACWYRRRLAYHKSATESKLNCPHSSLIKKNIRIITNQINKTLLNLTSKHIGKHPRFRKGVLCSWERQFTLGKLLSTHGTQTNRVTWKNT